MKTLIIGYGNDFRSDDGVGIYVANRLAEENFPNLEVRTQLQLQVELVEEFQKYDLVILIDSSANGEPCQFERVAIDYEVQSSSSHRLRPQLLTRLAAEVNIPIPYVYLCTIRGRYFDFGNKLSEEVLINAEKAVRVIKCVLETKQKEKIICMKGILQNKL